MGFVSEINAGSFVALLFIFLLFNVVLIFHKGRKARQQMKQIKEERIAAQKREQSLKGDLSREQEEAERRIELQNKTFELYEQVRKKAAEDSEEKKAGSDKAGSDEF